MSRSMPVSDTFTVWRDASVNEYVRPELSVSVAYTSPTRVSSVRRTLVGGERGVEGGGVAGGDAVVPLTLSVQLPESALYGYTVTVCVPVASVPLQESAAVPPRFEQREPFTLQSMSRSMPVRLTFTAVLDSSLNSYDFSPEPVSDTLNGSVRTLRTDTTGTSEGSAGTIVPGGAGVLRITVDEGGSGSGGATQTIEPHSGM